MLNIANMIFIVRRNANQFCWSNSASSVFTRSRNSSEIEKKIFIMKKASNKYQHVKSFQHAASWNIGIEWKRNLFHILISELFHFP